MAIAVDVITIFPEVFAPVLRVGQSGDVDLAQVLVGKARAGDHDPLGARGADVEPEGLRQGLPQGGAVAGNVGADPVHVEHLDLGSLANTRAERRQLVLGLQVGLDTGERTALDLAAPLVLGRLARALQHGLRHAPAEALASGECQRGQER